MVFQSLYKKNKYNDYAYYDSVDDTNVLSITGFGVKFAMIAVI